MNLSLSQKQYKLLLFFLTFFIFIYWFAHGYNATLWVDVMNEMSGTVVHLKFPENLWTKITHPSGDWWLSHWHNGTRWGADIFSYIIYNIFGRLHLILTKDPVTAVYFTQGIIIGIYYTSLSWIMAWYVKQALKISAYSYTFLFMLFYSGISLLTFNFYYSSEIFRNLLNFPTALTIEKNFVSLSSHYFYPTILLLLSLYPFWKAFFNNNQWDEKYDLLPYKTIWYICIILSFFSSNGIGFMSLVCFAFIGLLILCHSPQKNIIDRVKYLLLTPPSYVKGLYFGAVLGAVAFISKPQSPTNSFRLDILIKWFCVFSIPFILLYALYLLYHVFQKITHSSNNISKFVQLTILSHIVVLLYIFSLLFSGRPYGVYRQPMLIIITLTIFLTIMYLLTKFKSSVAFSLLFIVLLSRYLYYVPRYPDTVPVLTEREYYQELHNKSKTNNRIIIYPGDPIMEIVQNKGFIPIIQEFTRYTGIIDHDVELILHEDFIIKTHK